jgi:putative nucleotidyltransferase with HDIG domain
MSPADRRHAVGVARRAVFLAKNGGADAGRDFTAAALLHDVGKTESGLGTFGRVWATMAALVVGRDHVLAWKGRSGYRKRFALYLEHDRLGAEMLEKAGSETLTVSWAREHHLPVGRWTVDSKLGAFLKEADGD